MSRETRCDTVITPCGIPNSQEFSCLCGLRWRVLPESAQAGFMYDLWIPARCG